MSSKSVVDPLKPVDQIFEPDSRQAYFLSSFEGLHEDLSAIVLSDAIPEDVRQLFETAKNVALYSWFVYRFHEVAELVAFSALEMALRERYLAEHPGANPKCLSLGKLMKYAKKEGWIRDAALITGSENFRRRVEIERGLEEFKEDILRTNDSIQIEGPSEEDIDKALGEFDIGNYMVETAAALRNNLAHGSSEMKATSVSILSTTAGIINQLFRMSP